MRNLAQRTLLLLAFAILAPALGTGSAHAGDPAPGAFAFDGGVLSMTTASDGSTYVGGGFSEVLPPTGGGLILSAAGDGRPDPGRFPQVAGTVQAVTPDGGGGWFIGGAFTAVGTVAIRNLAHITATGAVDANWTPNPSGPVWALEATGSIVFVGGNFSQIDGSSRSWFAALDPATGALQTGFPASNGMVVAMARSGTTLYVGGLFTVAGGQARNRIAAVNTSTQAVTGFNPNADGRVDALAVAGSTVYAAGEFTFIGGQSRASLAALDAGAGTATAWNPAPDSQVVKLATSGTTLYASGYFTTIAGQSRRRLAAFTLSTGALTGFNPIQSASEAAGVLAVSGSTLYVGGTSGIGGVTRHGVAALDVTTGIATAWNPNVGGEVMAIGAAGTNVYVGGRFAGAGAPILAGTSLVRLHPDGSLDTTWNPQVSGIVNVLESEGPDVYFGGSFSSVAGQPRKSLASVKRADASVNPWAPQMFPNGWVRGLVVEQSAAFASGIADTGGYRIVALVATGAGDLQLWSRDVNGQVNDLALSGSALYAGGGFSSVAGSPRNLIAALDFNNGLPTAWNAGASGTRVWDLDVVGGAVRVGGEFSWMGGQSRRNFAVLDPATAAASALNPSPEQGVFAIAQRGSALYLGGLYTTLSGVARNRLASLDPAGAVGPWSPNLNDLVSAFTINGSTVLAGGSFTAATDRVAGALAQFDLDAPDTKLDAGPTGVIRDRRPQFAFSASKPRATFTCSLDTGPSLPCASPWTPPALEDGAHTLDVQATDATGLPDTTPARLAFTVDATAPDTRLLSGPPAFAFEAEAGATFECALDGGAYSVCSSPFTWEAPAGAHTFSVRATDTAGNIDASPATRAFTVDAPVEPPVGPPGTRAPTPTPTPTPKRPAAPSRTLSIPFSNGYDIGAIARSDGCRGRLTLELKLGKRVLDRRRTVLDRRCRYKTTFRVLRSRIGSAKRLTVVVRFGGNRHLGRTTNRFTVRVPVR